MRAHLIKGMTYHSNYSVYVQLRVRALTHKFHNITCLY